jgi:flagellar biogenesis protein FliO
MPPTENTESIALALAAFLFAFALISLLAWAFKSFVLTRRSGASYLKGRDRRLGVVETASVDVQRSSSSAATTSST